MELPETKQDRLTALGDVLMADVPNIDIRLPDNLTADEMTEWLDGAGFSLASTINVRGDECRVYAVRIQTPGWPSYVTVTLNTQQRGLNGFVPEYVTQQFYDKYDLPHDFDPTCRCGDCADEGYDRYEDAALRKAGM